MYVKLFDGLRGYYCTRPKPLKEAGFQSAMSLSFLCGFNLASLILLAAFASRNHQFVDAIFRNRILALPLGAVVAYVHVLWAKSTGLYYDRGATRYSEWARLMMVYVAMTGTLAVAACICAFIAGRNV
jgi:hypothetical protein